VRETTITPQFPELVALFMSDAKCARRAAPDAGVAARIAVRAGARSGARRGAGGFAALATVGRAIVVRVGALPAAGALVVAGALVAPACARAPTGEIAGRRAQLRRRRARRVTMRMILTEKRAGGSEAPVP
jgi:hypothetical protein